MVGGNYTVTITLHFYSNPQNTCSICRTHGFYGCCDYYSLRESQCTGTYRCDTSFQYCLLPLGSFSSNPPIQCSNLTGTAPQIDSAETINFPLGEVLGLSNPFLLSGISNVWTVCKNNYVSKIFTVCLPLFCT